GLKAGLFVHLPGFAAVLAGPALTGGTLHLHAGVANFNADDRAGSGSAQHNPLARGAAIARVDERSVAASGPQLTTVRGEGGELNGCGTGTSFHPVSGFARSDQPAAGNSPAARYGFSHLCFGGDARIRASATAECARVLKSAHAAVRRPRSGGCFSRLDPGILLHRADSV